MGLLGAGKTMLAVQHALGLARRRNALLLSNIRIDAAGVEFHQLGVGADGIDLEELTAHRERARGEDRGLVLLIDEVGILMPARFWQSFPIDLIYTLSQSRKMRLDLVYTSQDVEMVDSMLRRLTQWVYRVKCFPAPSIERREAGRRPWFFVVDRWRPMSIDKKDKRLGKSYQRYRRHFEGAYDTDELVAPPVRLVVGASRRSEKQARGSGGPSSRGTGANAEDRPLPVDGATGSRRGSPGVIPDEYQPLGMSASTARNAEREDGAQLQPSGLLLVPGVTPGASAD